MINTILRQEAGKTYLAVQNESDSSKEYLVSMVTRNQIEGLLPCKMAYEQTQKMLYYDVTNKISLEHLYKDKSLTCREIRRLFDGLADIKKSGQKYLLEEEYYVFDPQYIFVDMETDTIQVMYIPFINEEEGQLGRFADFLLKKVEQNDDGAVKLAYMFYKMISLETFSLEGFSVLVDKEIVLEERKEERQETISNNSKYEAPQREEIDFEYYEKNKYVCPTILFIGSVGLIITFVILRKDFIYAIYILLFAIILTIAFIISIIKLVNRIVETNREKEMQEAGNNCSVEEFWEDEETQIFYESSQTDADSFIKKEYFLKWTENGTEKQYKIETFPILIGKLKGEVDCLINDVSVSRIHARVMKDADDFFLEDVDSKNGTYVDNIRLQTGQRALINTESNIRLGNVHVVLETGIR